VDAVSSDTSGTADTTATDATATTDAETADTTTTVVSWAPSHYTTYNVSGSRLTAQAVTDDNDNSAVMWFDDSSLGVRCGVQATQDGARYCMPESLDIERVEGFFYLDAGCATPALMAPTSCGSPVYAHYRQNRYRATPTTSATIWGASFGGGCDAYSVGNGQSVFSLAQLDLQTLVAFPKADETVHEIDAAVGVLVLHGTDGTSVAHSLYDRAVGRAAGAASIDGPLDDDGKPTKELRLVPRNPFQGGITSYQRYDCAFSDLRYANGFLAEVVDPIPAYVEVIILPAHLPQNSSRFRKITNTQTVYCDASGVERQVPANQRLYVIGAGAADLSGQPILTIKPGTGAGTNHRHYLTAADVPIIPELALTPTGNFHSVVDVGGVDVGVADIGGTLRGVPAKGLRPYWDTSFIDNSCVVPFADSSLAPGDILATLHEGGQRSCFIDLGYGLPRVRSLWQVNDEPARDTQTWMFIQSNNVLQCDQRDPSHGEPVLYRDVTDVTESATANLPALSIEGL